MENRGTQSVAQLWGYIVLILHVHSQVLSPHSLLDARLASASFELTVIHLVNL